jgi:hypothetical protein
MVVIPGLFNHDLTPVQCATMETPEIPKTKFMHSNTPTNLKSSKKTPYQASYAPQNKHQEVKTKDKEYKSNEKSERSCGSSKCRKVVSDPEPRLKARPVLKHYRFCLRAFFSISTLVSKLRVFGEY